MKPLILLAHIFLAPLLLAATAGCSTDHAPAATATRPSASPSVSVAAPSGDWAFTFCRSQRRDGSPVPLHAAADGRSPVVGASVKMKFGAVGSEAGRALVSARTGIVCVVDATLPSFQASKVSLTVALPGITVFATRTGP